MKILKEKHNLLELNNNWLEDEPRWYMLYVRSGDLKRVTDELNKQDIFTYRPVLRTDENLHRRSGNRNYLFPHYMFVHLSRKNLRSIPSTTERLCFVHRIDRPVFISDDELESMHIFLKTNTNAFVQKSKVAGVELSDYYAVGDDIVKNSRQLSIESLGCVILSPFGEVKKPQGTYSLRRQLREDLNTSLLQLFGKASARV